MIKKIIVVLIVVVILIAARGLIKQTMETIRSGERLFQSAEAVYKLEIKNKELKAQLAVIQSPEYIEAEVRNKLGLAKKGETIVVIPEEKLKAVLGASQSAVVRLPNWLGWLKVFFK
ncbi:septum formation initiator family protein [Candidatus Daviesbacteria bacterium]|nr:septum formation initiator family protein [Candidatus Daviesbacteria bacterium]